MNSLKISRLEGAMSDRRRVSTQLTVSREEQDYDAFRMSTQWRRVTVGLTALA